METSETASDDQSGPLVSIVIPAYNESVRIGDTLSKIRDFLIRSGDRFQMIVVDDGSADDTVGIVERLGFPELRILRNDGNRGKGYSVRRGVLEAVGEFVLFSDADLSAPIEEFEKLLGALRRENADIAVGSRGLDAALIGKHQSIVRESGGKLFNKVVRALLGLKIRDTQCGFKLFRREIVGAVFEKQTTDGFGFDPEILFLAARRNLKIVEVPVRWNHAEGSKVRFLRDGIGMVLDMIRIRWNDIRGRYS
jgi:glycosyltransferase involved in cell wall biosynthesis